MNLNFYVPSGYTARKTDETGTVTYVGYSEIGEPDTGNWIIQRITDDAGDMTIEYSSAGVAWVDRQTLTYR